MDCYRSFAFWNRRCSISTDRNYAWILFYCSLPALQALRWPVTKVERKGPGNEDDERAGSLFPLSLPLRPPFVTGTAIFITKFCMMFENNYLVSYIIYFSQ